MELGAEEGRGVGRGVGRADEGRGQGEGKAWKKAGGRGQSPWSVRKRMRDSGRRMQQSAGPARTYVNVAQVREELAACDVLQDHVQVAVVLEAGHQPNQERVVHAFQDLLFVQRVLHL